MAELRNYEQGEGKDWNVKNSIAYGKGPVHEDFKGLQKDINRFAEEVGFKKLEVDGSFLVVPSAHDDRVWRSCRNLPGALYRVVSDLNAYEVLKQRYLVIEADALKVLEERFARG
jgi:ribosomal protein L4